MIQNFRDITDNNIKGTTLVVLALIMAENISQKNRRFIAGINNNTAQRNQKAFSIFL